MLSRLRKLVFKIRHKNSAGPFAESMRRVSRLARLMTIMQQGRRRKVGGVAGCWAEGEGARGRRTRKLQPAATD
jgi:hypothetical protein